MSIRAKKMFWTTALVLFLAFAIYGRLQWLSLLIPGSLLLWYGLVTPVPRRRIAVRKHGRSGLN
jgi:hypothetical protein